MAQYPRAGVDAKVPNAAHLAWMRLEPGRGPVLSSVRYYTGNPNAPWTAAESDATSALRHESEAAGVIELPPYYSSLSVAWLPDARRWIALYSTSIVEGLAKPGARNFPAAPIMVRVASDPWSWSDEMQVFNACRDHAYGQLCTGRGSMASTLCRRSWRHTNRRSQGTPTARSSCRGSPNGTAPRRNCRSHI